MNKPTLASLAAHASSFFVLRQRDTGESFWVKDGEVPDWVQALTMDAHGTMGPDDHRYAFIVEALDAYQEADIDPDDVSPEPSIYTAELTAWLASRLDRLNYVDEARAEQDPHTSAPLSDLLAWGQAAEMREVFDSVRASLEARLSDELEALEDEADED